MKTQFTIALLALSVLKFADTLACSPPPSPLYVQPADIAQILTSPELFAALQSLRAELII